jgi:hypothetical protein
MVLSRLGGMHTPEVFHSLDGYSSGGFSRSLFDCAIEGLYVDGRRLCLLGKFLPSKEVVRWKLSM